MDIESKIDLVMRPPTEELVVESELRSVLEANSKPRHYIGFEISGLLHVGSLVQTGFKIRDLQKAGFHCIVLLADWHSVANKKLDGDWEKIREASKYYTEAFKFFCPGVETIFASDLYAKTPDFWKWVIEFSQHVTLARDARCLTIMGRQESESLSVAQYFYPPMQAVDMHALDVQLAHAGTDQRKIHMLAREVFPKMSWKPPLALHHHLLPGLSEPQKVTGDSKADGGVAVVKMSKTDEVAAAKMSKSKPDSAIFIHDSPEEIKRKLGKAYCPPSVEGNPVLEFAKYLVFHEKKELAIDRSAKFGGSVSFASYEELEQAFVGGKLHAMDLKNGVASALTEILAPVRKHFEGTSYLDVYKDAKITR